MAHRIRHQALLAAPLLAVVLICVPFLYAMEETIDTPGLPRALIDQWKKEGKFRNFIDYEKVEAYKGFGGIRIEDDVLVTETGYRVLGKPIPKTVGEIESLMANPL